MKLTFQGRNIENIPRIHSKEGIILKPPERLGPMGNDLDQKCVVSTADSNGKKSTKVLSRYGANSKQPKAGELGKRHSECPKLQSHKLIFVSELQYAENFAVGASLNGEFGNLFWSVQTCLLSTKTTRKMESQSRVRLTERISRIRAPRRPSSCLREEL